MENKISINKNPRQFWPEVPLGQAVDRSGQIINFLLVLYRTNNRGKKDVCWVCKCIHCNQYYVKIASGDLSKGKIKSCGCIKKENMSKIGKQKMGNNKPINYQKNDEIGPYHAIFLEEIEGQNKYTHRPDKYFRRAKFLCPICKTKSFEADINSVKQGASWKCDECQEASQGEFNVYYWLTKLNIKFERQKRFSDCRDKISLPFDFYLPDYNCCIECDGEQHFKPIKLYGGEEGFNDRKKKDGIKTQYCKNNNIKLIRIPYTDYDKINDEYIKLRLGKV